MADEKPSVTTKMWRRVSYCPGTTNCGNCTHASKNVSWPGDNGWCTVLAMLPFKVLRYGICKYHSNFGGGNIER